jgi:hypothetical protein
MVSFPAIFLVFAGANSPLAAAGGETAAHYYQATPQSQRCVTMAHRQPGRAKKFPVAPGIDRFA